MMLIIGQSVNILRAQLAPSLIAVLPYNIFHNTAQVTAVNGERVEVEVLCRHYWFDAEALSVDTPGVVQEMLFQEEEIK